MMKVFVALLGTNISPQLGSCLSNAPEASTLTLVFQSSGFHRSRLDVIEGVPSNFSGFTLWICFPRDFGFTPEKTNITSWKITSFNRR